MINAIVGIGGLLSLAGGFAILKIATTALHEIEAFLLLIIGAVCLSGVAVVEAINKLRTEIKNLSNSAVAQRGSPEVQAHHIEVDPGG